MGRRGFGEFKSRKNQLISDASKVGYNVEVLDGSIFVFTESISAKQNTITSLGMAESFLKGIVFHDKVLNRKKQLEEKKNQKV